MAYDHFNQTVGSGVCEYLTESQSLVLLYLSIRVNSDINEAYPSQSRIAYETGLKRDTVQKAISALKKLDLVRSRRAWAHRSRTVSTFYRVAPPDHIDALIAWWDPYVIAVRDAAGGTLNVRKLQRRLAELPPPAEDRPLSGEQLQMVSSSTDTDRGPVCSGTNTDRGPGTNTDHGPG